LEGQLEIEMAEIVKVMVHICKARGVDIHKVGAVMQASNIVRPNGMKADWYI